MARPIELIPARVQALWGWPAVLNFGLGALGTGFYAVSVIAAGLGQSLAVSVASWLGPLLVLAGLGAVATEAGRPLRGARVLTRFRTSWMSRELWIGGVFVLFVATDLAFPLPVHRALSALAALTFALAQGFIVRQARAVTAWNVPIMPLLFLCSALISGTGLYLMIEVIGGRRLEGVPAGGVLILLTTGLIVWVSYLRWSGEAAFIRAVAPLATGRGARLILGAGYAAPLLLIALTILIPVIAGLTLLPAGALMAGAQLYKKALLILVAGQFRPITLAGLKVPRQVSNRRTA